MTAAFGVHVSPGGEAVYVAGFNSDAIAQFTRDPVTGALTQMGSPNDCITQNATGCGTVNATGLDQPISIASVGSHVYTASGGGSADGAVAAFSRNPMTGVLTQLASPDDCITGAPSGCGRNNAARLYGPEDLAPSLDGENVYVAAFGTQGNAVVSLSRDPGTGGLSQLAAPADCVTFLASGCGTNNATGINAPQGVAVSPNGTKVYATGSTSDAIATFSRAAAGAITQLAAPDDCITFQSSGCGTTLAKGLNGARRAALSPDGKFLYVASPNSSAVASFAVVQPPVVTPPAQPPAQPPAKRKKCKKKKRSAGAAAKKKCKKKKRK
jgi:DNA-binding beta-propeller fold protein YncE